MPHDIQRVVVLGQGYVGLPLAMRGVEAGYTVVGYDVDVERVASLASGHSYVGDVASARLAGALKTARYLPTHKVNDLADFDVAVITVPTPLREGRPDLSFIDRATREIGPHIRPGSIVVLESTSYPGTTEEFVAPLLEECSGLTVGKDFSLGYSPERIDPGNGDFGLENTPKLVSGIDSGSLFRIRGFYASLVADPIVVSSPRVAELAKLLENTFRHVNIALVNELAMFATELGVDIWEAIDAAATKPFGFMKFTPGPGVGGHCLPIDPSYLSWHVRTSLGRSFRFVELANDINDHMPEYVIRRVIIALNQRSKPLNGSTVLLLGLTYKAGTSDLRESPALAVARGLQHLGAALSYFDQHIEHSELARYGLSPMTPLTKLSQATLSAFDAVVVLTAHPDVDYQLVGRSARYVLDTRHKCASPSVEYL